MFKQLIQNELINLLRNKYINTVPNLKGFKILEFSKNEIKYIEILHNPDTGKEIKNKKVYKLNECDKFTLNWNIKTLLN